MKILKRFLVATICLFLGVSSYATAQAGKTKDIKQAVDSGTLAVVNGAKVSATEFNNIWTAYVAQKKKVMTSEAMSEAWEKASKKQLLEELVDQRLIEQEAKKRKITVSSAEIDTALQRVKKSFKNEDAFKKQLAKEGLTVSAFRERVENQIRGEKLKETVIKEQVKAPSDEQVRKLFDSVKANLEKPAADVASDVKWLTLYARQQNAERVKIQAILFGANNTPEQQKEALARVQDVKAKLDKGAKFDEMAAKYSDDKITARNGGEIGYIVRGQMVKEFDDAVFSLPVGAVSGIVKTSLGYHLIRVEEKKAATEFRYETAKRYLSEFIVRESAQKTLIDFVASIKKTAAIEIKMN